MASIAVYDACVLYPAAIRDFLIRLAMDDIVQARWSQRILDECFTNIQRNRPDLDPKRLKRTEGLMNGALPATLIEAPELPVEILDLPDPKDHHVVSTAIYAHAQAIVTFNTKDFPDAELERFDIRAVHPDEFVLNLCETDSLAILRVLETQAARLKKPSVNPAELVRRLANQGLSKTALRMNAFVDV